MPVGDLELTFLEQPGVGRPFEIAAQAARPPAAALAAVLSTVWAYTDGPEGLIPQLGEAEGGQEWEEAAGWEKVPGGLVSVFYLSDRALIPDGTFRAAARAMAEFHLEVARLRDVDGALERFLRGWLAGRA